MRPLLSLLTRLTIAVAIATICFMGTTALTFLFWRPTAIHTNTIQIVDATYGGNCMTSSSARSGTPVRRGNATASVMQACENTNLLCPYIIDQLLLGDPVVGCQKDFEANWRCGHDPEVRQTRLNPEAKNQIAWLSCSERP